MNYSFWADEAYISGIAAQLALGKLTFLQAINAPGITYQKLNMFIIAIFLKLFGIGEAVSRIPSIIMLLLGVIFIFLLTKKLSNKYGAMLAAFLYGFSHLNLSYATQAKPYIFVEFATIAIIYLLVKIDEQKQFSSSIKYHVLIIIIASIAVLFHYIGIFLLALYFVHLLQSFRKLKVRSYWWLLLVIPCLFLLGIELIPVVVNTVLAKNFFTYNHTYQAIKLFAYKYSLISLCAGLGFVWIFKKNPKISISIFFYIFIILLMTSFEVYIFNIRYVLSLFGLIFLYFGIFWAKVGEKYMPKKPWVIPLVVMLLIYITGYKIVRLPQAYFNPNMDKYGDVQIANYKDFYAELKQRFPDYKDRYVVNDTFDVEYWYFGRYSDAYFMKGTTTPTQHAVVKQAKMYGTLDDFKKMMKEHPQGLLIMEDWQSFLPDDIKMYAKKNLKLELRVESLKEAPDDPWPLALYSWGY
ncbi:MAG: glycosyltransferase family 39 protein [Candidatus Roizmanbacteria bacterium]|nr:glycosyltransferase family 39 protein [Candidatus Roizmanbacteria bacterium]